jgi:hypothetical protein
MSRNLPQAEQEILDLAGVTARLGLRLLEKGPQSMTVMLRRHEFVAVRETVTLLEHISGLKRSGITPPDMTGIRELIKSRREALEAALLSAEDVDMIRVEPGVELNLKSAKIDGSLAISAFEARILGQGAPNHDMADEDPGSALLFADYVSSDLPEDERDLIRRKIASTDQIKKFSHDELIIITKLRQVLTRINGYGYGVAKRRRPLFSQARRNVLWSVPRVGAVMVTHLPSWHRMPEIGHMLLDLRRYEQHMRDLAMVPEDDDWFTAQDPLVRAVRRDALTIHLRGIQIVSKISQGPSTHRFDKAFFDIFPGPQANYTTRFLELAQPITNATAFAGICGRGERDLAMMQEEITEAARTSEADNGILGAIRGFFT